MVICLEQGANDLHVVQLMPLPLQHLLIHENLDWFNLSGASLPSLSWKKAIKQLSVLKFTCYLWSPYVIGQTIYIFILFLSSSSFFFFPRLISAVGDWMSAILPHMVWP